MVTIRDQLGEHAGWVIARCAVATTSGAALFFLASRYLSLPAALAGGTLGSLGGAAVMYRHLTSVRRIALTISKGSDPEAIFGHCEAELRKPAGSFKRCLEEFSAPSRLAAAGLHARGKRTKLMSIALDALALNSVGLLLWAAALKRGNQWVRQGCAVAMGLELFPSAGCAVAVCTALTADREPNMELLPDMGDYYRSWRRG